MTAKQIKAALRTGHAKGIEQVLSEFDFKRVFIAMKATGWRWAKNRHDGDDVPEGLRLPSIARLKRQARMSLENAAKAVQKPTSKDEWVEYSSGGIHARAYKTGVVELWFAVAQASNREL